MNMNKLKQKDSIAIIVVVLLVLVYIIAECYSVTRIQLETSTAALSTVYESVDSTAVIIRDEHPLHVSADGVTVSAVNDGDKVNVGGNIAMVFSSKDKAGNYSKYVQTQKQLAYYENLESQTIGQAASVDSINSEIDKDVNEYIRCIADGDTQSVETAGGYVNDGLIRRQMIIGENVNLVSIIQDLRKQAESYSLSATPDRFITTDESGVFSGYTDGFEQSVDYAEIQELTVDDVEMLTKKFTEKKDSSNLGKIIKSYSWYMATVVDADVVQGIENGSKLQIALKDNGDTVLTMRIVSGAQPEPGAEKTVLILECAELNEQLLNLRVEDIEIRFKSYEGIKAPASALHVVDGKKGVYVLISSQVKFRQADVIYTDDDYVLLSYDADNKKGIRIYDKIITQGKDLEDGKVYT